MTSHSFLVVTLLSAWGLGGPALLRGQPVPRAMVPPAQAVAQGSRPQIDWIRREIVIRGERCPLSSPEYHLLEVLVHRGARGATATRLIREMGWQPTPSKRRLLAQTLASLRTKLSADADHSEHLVGVGGRYRLRLPSPPPPPPADDNTPPPDRPVLERQDGGYHPN